MPPRGSRMLVGVDIGGTFTDFCASVDGRLHVHKVLSTPADPARAMLAGLAALCPAGLAGIARISHGSTVVTNAILERKGARTALIATQGFRDILAIGRQDRPELYALQPQLPAPLIPRRWCYEVPERLDPSGAVRTPLDMRALDAVLDDMAAEGIEAVAVCLLYSYVNPAHEHAVRDRILARRLLDEERIALSCEVLPEFREYERASTVALEAYVRPVIGQYVQRLADQLPAVCGLRIMKSDGGVMGALRARRSAVHTALSGPAAGAIGGFALAQLAGYDRAITIDMGGTSTDVALCPGQLVRRAESAIDGLPLRTRMLDIETIGAGGGSIARLDAGGVLRVGPESAGADPGPIVYGAGGKEVTVTDANALLGRLDRDRFLGGAMPLYPARARAAMGAGLARALGIGVQEAALGIVEVANVNIDRALRRVSVARGHDPRGFTLVAFGGAGPLHACEVAAGLGIPRVLVPRYPGVLCALGLLMADVVLERSRAVLEVVSPELEAALRAQVDEMTALARADLAQEGIAEQAMAFAPLVDARYRGQSHELTIPFGEGVATAFHDAHARAYGHAMRERPVEVVNLRLQATGLIPKPHLEAEPVVPQDAGPGHPAHFGVGRVVCAGGEREADRYARERLPPGGRLAGPALVFQMDSTVYLPPGWSARVDGYRNLVLERAGALPEKGERR
ncbi:MAG: hydantoinase/oxoprolinase family protein [Anaerolineae bacterium]|nr:hydantoinase/oxoprolinase family protein [Anaerolineae bacterium]